MHLPERDGIYADLCLLDLFLRERRARPLAGVEGDGGTSTSSPGRRSTAGSTSTSTAPSYDAVEAAGARRPPRVAADRRGRRSRSRGRSALDTGDGVKWFLADGSWLLVRASGTEPLVRVYTEATAPDLRDELVVAGERLVRGG